MLVFLLINDVKHTPTSLPTIFTLFGYFHTLTYQDFKLKQNPKHARSVSFVH